MKRLLIAAAFVISFSAAHAAPLYAPCATAQAGSSECDGANESSTIIPNNTTAIVVKATPGQMYGLECFNNSGTIAYVKIYDAASATAGSGTPVDRKMCVSSTSGAGFVVPFPVGRVFVNGITYIVTTGIADNDTTAPAASTYIVNVLYK
jgi:hypothetical protein